MTAATGSERLDEGFTLIEILVAVAILGITFTALLTGLATITSGTDTHRKGAVVGTSLRQWAEGIEALPVTSFSCSGTPANQYSFATIVGSLPGYTAAAPIISYWNGTTFVLSPCKTGVEQQVKLAISSGTRDSETLTIVKLES